MSHPDSSLPSTAGEARTQYELVGEARPPAVLPQAAGGLREVILLAYPVILTQMSMTTMHVVDSAMVGRLGASELAAVGFGGVWIWTALCFFVGTASAVQTFVAQHYGAGEMDRCGYWTWQGLWASVPLTFVAVVLLFSLLGPLLNAFGPESDMRALASSYMSFRLLGSVGVVAGMCLTCFFRGLGDTRTPLYVALVANVVNAVLDYGLIFGELGLPKWGVAGAGTATSIGEWTTFGILAVMFLRRAGVYETSFKPVDLQAVRRLLRTGMPVGGQWIIEMLSFAVFLTLVAHMGDAPMAASQIFISLLSLSFLQAIGLSIAVSTLVAQYIGAENLDAARASFHSGLKLAALLAGVIALIFIGIPEMLLRVFTKDPEVLAIGASLLRIGALYQALDAFAILGDGALRGAGDTRIPFLVRCALAWGFFVPLAYYATTFESGGLEYAWFAGAAYVAMLAAFVVYRFESGAWQKIRI